MFGWFDPVKKLEKRYAAALEKAELELAKSGDRAKHADMLAAAERIAQELDALQRERTGA